MQAGGSFDIDYAIYGPDKNILIDGQQERQGDMVFTANDPGEYQFCFMNEMSTFAEKTIDFEISVENEPRPDVPQKQTDGQPARGVGESVMTLTLQANNIHRVQKYFRTRENRNESTVQSTISRIKWFSIIESMLIIGMSILQVYVVRMFFSSRSKLGFV